MANRDALHKLVGPGVEQQDIGIFSSSFCHFHTQCYTACSLSGCYTQSHQAHCTCRPLYKRGTKIIAHGTSQSQPVQRCLRYTGQGRIHTANYSLLPVDLRDLGALQASLESAGFQPTIPTYVLAECVLVYMEPHESTALLKHLGQQLPSAVCVVYEQVLPYHPLCFARTACHAIDLTRFLFASSVYWRS